ncbi:lytic murein transglycosylase B [Endozoicomonas sp. GU-1]|uniref:lytic murein transglycosylase B n=1 Tax=Endozoicomonas sp. GU-1 TaxID=3009078 RepID=UPI0022B3C966|nr:lytic murein transglycosylase B [Endozoicomonas sp. GU-1]WBA82760.1 lytic murein transglycosylase B [Endozoicomonas sp. GU-1]WBA85690.1 lytic murein transglycosylase B [Endozoicomonas sp. GU-1]
MKNFPGVFRRMFRGGLLMAAVVATPVTWALAQENHDSDYLGRQDVDAFIDELVTEHRFSRTELEDILAGAERSERALELISRPAEGTLEWKDYRKIFITPERIAKGVSFWEENAETLARVEQELGVPANIIVAIIGVETYYGRQTGGFKVLDALTTLGFDFPRRGEFFRKELKNFLLLAREQNLDVDELTGSYAGAMGIPQFMPSSYRAYAVDYTGDQQANIWLSDEDAIASVANYLQKHGWKYGSGVAVQAKVSGVKHEQIVSSGLKPDKKLSLVQKAGWAVPKMVPKSSKVLAMKHEGSAGAEYWVGLHNFYVITRYNRSQMYALAVYQLSREVKDSYKRSLALHKQVAKGKQG